MKAAKLNPGAMFQNFFSNSTTSTQEMEIRAVLVGKVGVGKSALGNTLIGGEVFQCHTGFSCGTDRECQTAKATVDGVTVCVTETPGVRYDNTAENLAEIRRCVTGTPQPHAVILVIPCNHRFTKEDYDVAQTLLGLLGEDFLRLSLMVVFTHGGFLRHGSGDIQEAIRQEIKGAGEPLKEILRHAGNRYCVVDNTGPFHRRQEYAKVVFKTIPTLSLRLILIGKTGNGKSTTANTIIGQELFEPATGMSSGTDKCAWKTVSRGIRTLEVTDTPGICDTHREPGEVEREIAKCLATMTPGPDVILFVVRGRDRFTKEEYEAYLNLKQVFGQEMTKYMMIVLTRVTEAEFKANLENSRKSLPENFLTVLREADNRYVCFSSNLENKSSRDLEGMALLQTAFNLKSQNGYECYSNELVRKFDQKMTARAQETHVPVHVVKQNVVEEKDRGFFASLLSLIPSALKKIGCSVM